MTYFNEIETLEDAHAAYREWAKKLHPDLYPDGEREDAHARFTAMAAEYKELTTRLTKPKHRPAFHAKKFEKKVRKVKLKVRKEYQEEALHHGTELAGTLAKSWFKSFMERAMKNAE